MPSTSPKRSTRTRRCPNRSASRRKYSRARAPTFRRNGRNDAIAPDARCMTQDELKQAVARAAIAHVVEDEYVGVGSGSTANFFIDELARIKGRIKGAVASSVKTAERLKNHHIAVVDLNSVADLPVYIDGADEVTERGA